MNQEKVGNTAIVMAWIAHNFGDRALAVGKIARESGITGKMGPLRPLLVIPRHETIGPLKPAEARLAALLFRFMDGQNHRTEEGRLGTRQVVGPVGIQDAA